MIWWKLLPFLSGRGRGISVADYKVAADEGMESHQYFYI
jgi:hypothetical protein